MSFYLDLRVKVVDSSKYVFVLWSPSYKEYYNTNKSAMLPDRKSFLKDVWATYAARLSKST